MLTVRKSHNNKIFVVVVDTVRGADIGGGPSGGMPHVTPVFSNDSSNKCLLTKPHSTSKETDTLFFFLASTFYNTRRSEKAAPILSWPCNKKR